MAKTKKWKSNKKKPRNGKVVLVSWFEEQKEKRPKIRTSSGSSTGPFFINSYPVAWRWKRAAVKTSLGEGEDL
jgi:hypothetical protein